MIYFKLFMELGFDLMILALLVTFVKGVVDMILYIWKD